MSSLRDLKRPMPPAGLIEDALPRFIPAPEIITWAMQTFILPDSPLYNPEHDHLAGAQLAALWTNVPNSRQMRRIVGTAEMPGQARGAKWQKARADQQMEDWFGAMPDFLITIDAVYAAEASDDQWCALLEHECLHCGQDRDVDGLPKFTKDGLPAFAMRSHDFEEFVSVIRRYGISAAGGDAIAAAISAGRSNPEALVGWSCGTCGRPG